MEKCKNLVLNIPITCYVHKKDGVYVGFIGLCQSYTQAPTLEELEKNVRGIIEMQQDYYNYNLGENNESK